MRTRSESELHLRQIINAVLLAGIIILGTGVYYCVIKAGIPYQDPPLELQIQYAIHMEIGEILIKNGFLMSVCGGIARLILELAVKKRQKKASLCDGREKEEIKGYHDKKI